VPRPFFFAQLEPVHALLRRPAYPLPRRFRRVDRPAFPARARPDIDEDPWRHDLVGRTPRSRLQSPIHAVARTGIADRRNAVRHPELVDVLRRRSLRASTGVRVSVHESRQHEHAVGIELVRGVPRTPVGVDRQVGCAQTTNLGDPVPLDHDVHRALGGRSRPVHDHGTAYDQPLERTHTFIGAAVGGVLYCPPPLFSLLWPGRARKHPYQANGDDETGDCSFPAHLAPPQSR
jgi:hypothetical protein